MAMSTFRRSLKAETKKMGGKGGKGAWRERWRLPTSGPTPMIFIEAEYTDPNPPAEQVETDPATGRPREVKHAFFKGRKHKRKSTKNGKEWYADEMCSAGYDPHNPQPCVGCYAMDSGDKTVTVSDIFYFGVVHLALYHGHPVLDDKNNIRMRQDGQGMLTNFTECTARSCNFCRTLAGAPLVQDPNWPGWRAEHISTTFGQRRYLEIGKGHLSNLESWDGSVSSTCQGCSSQLMTDGFKCPHCHSRCIDMATDQRTDEQIQEAVATPYPCMRCNRPVLLIEEVSCDRCIAMNVGQGAPFPFFGTVFHALREGEGMKSAMVLRRFETLDAFSQVTFQQQTLFGPTIGQILQGKPIQTLVSELAVPYDFPEMNKPRPLQEQAKRLDLSMPPSAGGGGGYQPATGGYQPAGPGTGQGGYNPQAYGQPQQQPAAPAAYAPYGAPMQTPQAPAQQQWQAPQGQPPQQQQWQPNPPQAPVQQQHWQAPQGQPQQPFQPTQQPGPQPFVPGVRPNFS